VSAFTRNLAVALATVTFCSTQLSAAQDILEPIVTKSKIEDLAAKCGAIVTVSYAPDFSEETGEVRENSMLLIGIERSNSPEAISCVQGNIPTVVTTLVGREEGVPALNQTILDTVLKECDWQKGDGFVGFVAGDELRFQPEVTAAYERVDCVMAGIRPYAPRMGFVGNERYSTEEEQK
jgi:hypothetical protein